MRALVGQYYVVLRSILRSHSHLRACLSRCRHCRIFFLTDPRNAGRGDLGCPFGCQEERRKRRSTERSVAYYRTAEGKVKKSLQNGKRREAVRAARAAGRELPTIEVKGSTVGYLGMVIGLIEGWPVSAAEIGEMLLRVLRQHRMARRRRIDYVVDYLRKNAP